MSKHRSVSNPAPDGDPVLHPHPEIMHTDIPGKPLPRIPGAIEYDTLPERHILCLDMKSFFASCAAVRLGLDPLTCYLAVVSDKNRSGSVVLAATPKLKKTFGIRTGSRLFEIPNDRRIRVVDAQMAYYLDMSMAITKRLEHYVPPESIHTYSIDESFIEADGTEHLWGTPQHLAARIQADILDRYGLPCAIGIGPNMLMAKVCLDLEAKKTGISEWTYADVPRKLWPIRPLSNMWGIGSRLERRLNNMGIRSIGQLAHFPLQRLEKAFGVMGNQLYYHAHGIDLSMLGAPIVNGQISYGKGQVLMRDYKEPEEIRCVLLEMAEEVARRARKAGMAGRTVQLGIGYSQAYGGGFHRAYTLPQPTSITKEIFDVCWKLFQKHDAGFPVRKISISLTNVVPDTDMQLDFFQTDRPHKRALGYAMDRIRDKYGYDAVLWGVSYTAAGTAKHRSTLLGGHQA